MLAITNPDADWPLGPSEEPSPRQRALSGAILEHVLAGPILARVRKHVLVLPDAQHWVSDPETRLAGPTALPTPYWARRDHGAPSVPAPVTWADGHSVTPKTCYASVRLTSEQLRDMRPFREVREGRAVTGDSDHFDPVMALTLADAFGVEVGRVFSASADDDADPVHPVAGYAGTATATLERHLTFGDLLDAYGAILRTDRWSPGVAWTSPGTYRRLRDERDAKGAPLHDRGEPLVLDTLVEPDGSLRRVPVVPVPGFSDSRTVVADARAVWAALREVYPGLLVRVDRTRHTEFATDRLLYRVAMRYDFGIPEGCEGAVRTIVHSEA
jgi:hypothetical protein